MSLFKSFISFTFLISLVNLVQAQIIPDAPHPITDATLLKHNETLLTEANDAIAEIESKGYFLEDTALTNYIRHIIQGIFPAFLQAENKIFIINDPSINASMGPDGSLILHIGLIYFAENEAQLASVICHELAHYIRRHSLKSFVFANEFSIKEKSTLDFKAKFSENAIQIESEADSLGMVLLGASQYDPGQAAAFMSLWPDVEEEEKQKWHEKLTKKRITYFPEHPKTKDRITFLKKEAQIYTGTVTNKEAYKSKTEYLFQNFIKFYRRYNGVLAMINLLEDRKKSIIEESPYLTNELYYWLGANYQELRCNNAELYKIYSDLKDKKLEDENQLFSEALNAQLKGEKLHKLLESIVEKKAEEYLDLIKNNEKYKDRVNMHLGLMAYQRKEYDKTLNYFNTFVNSPNKNTDKRYIRSLIDKINYKNNKKN